MIKLIHYSQGNGPLYFYGGWASNFANSTIILPAAWYGAPAAPPADLDTYHDVETFFQAAKAQTREDHNWVVEGSRFSTRKAKERGNLVDLRPDWEEIKYLVMVMGLRAKFAIPSFTKKLLKTGSRYIAEDSPTDDTWGIRDESGGMGGRNLLGLALMQTRDEIMTGARTSNERRASAERTHTLAYEHQDISNDDYTAMLRAASYG